MVNDHLFYLLRIPTIGTVFSIPDLAEYLNIPICLAHLPEGILNSNHREVNRQYYPTEQLRQSNAIKKNDSTHKA